MGASPSDFRESPNRNSSPRSHGESSSALRVLRGSVVNCPNPSRRCHWGIRSFLPEPRLPGELGPARLRTTAEWPKLSGCSRHQSLGSQIYRSKNETGRTWWAGSAGYFEEPPQFRSVGLEQDREVGAEDRLSILQTIVERLQLTRVVNFTVEPIEPQIRTNQDVLGRRPLRSQGDLVEVATVL